MDLFAAARNAHGAAVPDVDGPVLVDYPERFVYRAGDRVVKIGAAGAESARIVHEAEVQAAVGASRCPVPEVLALHRNEPAVFVMAFVDGEPLTDSWFGRSEQPGSRWAAAGAALRELHATPAEGTSAHLYGTQDGWWPFFAWWFPFERERHRAARSLPAEELDLLCDHAMAAIAGRPEPDMRLLHGDCSPFHWLLKDGEVTAAIDFGDAGLGDPAWDVAVMTIFNRDRLPALLDGYGAGDAFRSHVDAVLPAYWTMRHLAAYSWLVEHDFDPSPTVDALRGLARTVRIS